MYPWQAAVLDVGLEINAAGDWCFDDVVVTVPRQSGKTFMLAPLLAHRCGQFDPASVWMTAQRGKSVDRWQTVAESLMGTGLRDALRFTYGNSNERLAWPSGSSFRPFPPTATSMHGETPDLVIVDELWSFTGVQRQLLEESYKPAWSVKPGQAWLLSTAGTPRSEWLNQVRREGRDAVDDGQTNGIAYFEWSIPEMIDGQPVNRLNDDDLLQLVVGAHPRRDHGLRVETLRRELVRRPRSAWLRDYGNVSQSDDVDLGVFPALVLDRALNTNARIPAGARVCLGVAVDPDRRDASIGVAWRDGAGVAVTDEKRGDGTRWVAGEVIQLADRHDVACVAVQNGGAARSVADELDRAGVRLLRVSQPDWAAACARFADELSADRPSVTWNGSTAFAAAVAGAESRRVPSGLVWRSRDGDSISPLEARTLAVWAVDHAPIAEVQVDPEIW